MKIVWDGWFHAAIPFASEYAFALERLGHTVIRFDSRFEANVNKGHSYPDLLTELKTNKEFQSNIFGMWQKLKQLIHDQKPDLVIFDNAKLFTAPILREIRMEVPTVFICFDDNFSWLGRYIATDFSCVVAFNSYQAYKALNINTIYYNPHAVFSYHNKLDEKKVIDVALIGSAYMNRKLIVDELRRIYHIFVTTFGIGWDNDQYVIPNMELLKKIINRCKICIDIRLPSNMGMGLRFFETIGCGTLLLTDYRAEGEQCGYVYCEGTKAFANAIKFYLADEQTREHEAQMGYVEIHQKFSTKMVMQEMIKQIGEVLKL